MRLFKTSLYIFFFQTVIFKYNGVFSMTNSQKQKKFLLATQQFVQNCFHKNIHFGRKNITKHYFSNSTTPPADVSENTFSLNTILIPHFVSTNLPPTFQNNKNKKNHAKKTRHFKNLNLTQYFTTRAPQ